MLLIVTSSDALHSAFLASAGDGLSSTVGAYEIGALACSCSSASRTATSPLLAKLRRCGE